MKITHFGHSCLLLETGDVRILVDPGTMSQGFAEVRDLHAVLVTHNHHDHFDGPQINALMDANVEARLIVERATAEEAQGLVDPERIEVVSAGRPVQRHGHRDHGRRRDARNDPPGH